MKVTVKGTKDQSPIGYIFEVTLKNGYIPSVTVNSKEIGDIPDTDILNWYKTLLFAEMVIDCTISDILLHVQEIGQSAECDGTWISMQGPTSICSNSWFAAIRELIQSDNAYLSDTQMTQLVKIIHQDILPDIPVTAQQCAILERVIREQESYRSPADEEVKKKMDEILHVIDCLSAKRWNIVKAIDENKTNLAEFSLPFLNTFLNHVKTDHAVSCRQLLSYNYERNLLEQSLLDLPCQQIIDKIQEKEQPKRRELVRSIRQVVKDLSSAGLTDMSETEAQTRHNSRWRRNPCKQKPCDKCGPIYEKLRKLSKSVREEIDNSIQLVEVREMIDNHRKKKFHEKKENKTNFLCINPLERNGPLPARASVTSTGEEEYENDQKLIASLQEELENRIWDKSKIEVILNTMQLHLASLDGGADVSMVSRMEFPSMGHCPEWQTLDERVKELLLLGSPLFATKKDFIETTKAQCNLVIVTLKLKLKELGINSTLIATKNENGDLLFSPLPVTMIIKREKDISKRLITIVESRSAAETHARNFLQRKRSLRKHQMLGLKEPLQQASDIIDEGSQTISFELFDDEGTIECICDAFKPYADITRTKLKSLLSDHFKDIVHSIADHLADRRIPECRIWQSYETILVPKLMSYLETAYDAILFEDISAITKGLPLLTRDIVDIDGDLVTALFQDGRVSVNSCNIPTADKQVPVLRKRSSERDLERRRGMVCHSKGVSTQQTSDSESFAEECEQWRGDKGQAGEEVFVDDALPQPMPQGNYTEIRQSLFQLVWVSHADMYGSSWSSSGSTGERRSGGFGDHMDEAADPSSGTADQNNEKEDQSKNNGKERNGTENNRGKEAGATHTEPDHIYNQSKDQSKQSGNQSNETEDQSDLHMNQIDQSIKLSKASMRRFENLFKEFKKIKHERTLSGKLKCFVRSMEILNTIIQALIQDEEVSAVACSSDDLLSILTLILCNCDINVLTALHRYLEIVFDFTEGFVNDLGIEFFILVTYKNAFAYIIEKCQDCLRLHIASVDATEC